MISSIGGRTSSRRPMYAAIWPRRVSRDTEVMPVRSGGLQMSVCACDGAVTRVLRVGHELRGEGDGGVEGVLHHVRRRPAW